jgi:psiF repeat
MGTARSVGFIHPPFMVTARGCGPFSISIGASMMTISSRVATAALASLLLAGPAFAQTTTTTPAAPAAKAAPAKMAKTRSPESLECSKQADDKGLKGKERKKFRHECMKEAKDAASKK